MAEGDYCSTQDKHLMHRLDRIETEVEKIADAMIELAKTQQQMLAIAERQNHQSASIHELNVHVEEIRQKIPSYDALVDMKNNLIMVILTALLLGVLGLLGLNYFM